MLLAATSGHVAYLYPFTFLLAFLAPSSHSPDYQLCDCSAVGRMTHVLRDFEASQNLRDETSRGVGVLVICGGGCWRYADVSLRNAESAYSMFFLSHILVSLISLWRNPHLFGSHSEPR